MLSRESIIKNFSNLPGWRTRRKIVVIESDDWGSIRMPSLAAYHRLIMKGVPLENGDAKRYNRFDHLETENDLSALFEVLSSFADSQNKSPIITAVSVVANPEFSKIKAFDFQNYFYEPFTETFKKCTACENSFSLWKEGMRHKLFEPQFHGREHLNVALWMRSLQMKDVYTLASFDEQCWGFNNKNKLSISFQAAFELEYFSDLEEQKKILSSGLKLFNEILGYRASYFVPPNGPFNNKLEEIASVEGIRFMSASKIQKESLGDGKIKYRLHWIGQKNRYAQRYITRNCFFEPSQEGKDWVDSCLRDIHFSFRWYKPAVISSHRVNFMGMLNKKNKDTGLLQLNLLLTSIIKIWPEVEFMTSSQLGKLMMND